MKFKILSALALVSVVAFAAVTPPRTITADIIRTVGGLRVFWTLPNQLNDTFVGLSTAQTLTNKTIDGGANTFVNVPLNVFSGQVPVANGGTGRSSVLANSIPYGNGTGALNVTAAPLQFQVLRGNASGVPIFGTVNLAQSAAVGTSVLGVANGGTGVTSLPVAGAMTYSNGTAQVSLGAGTAGQYPISNGTTVAWGNNTPTKQIFTSTAFPLSNAYAMWVNTNNATTGATYSAVNGAICTVVNTIVASSRIVMTCTGAPNASGTLTKTSGTGDATITLSIWEAMGTYTTPANARLLKVYMTGGGGGSSSLTTAASSAAAGSGGAGGATAIKYISNPAATYYYNIGVGGIAATGQATQHGFPTMFASPDGSQFYLGDSGFHGGSCAAGTVVCVNGGASSITGSIGDIIIPASGSGNAIVFSGTHACAGGGGGTFWAGKIGDLCDFTTAGSTPSSQFWGAGANGAMIINGGASSAGAAGAQGVIVVEEYY